MRQARKKRYKLNLKNDPSHASVLEKAKAKPTNLRNKVKRYGNYTVFALQFAAVAQELRAMDAAGSAVGAIGELKTTWEDLSSRASKLTSVCNSNKMMLTNAAGFFEYLQRKAKQKSLPEQSH